MVAGLDLSPEARRQVDGGSVDSGRTSPRAQRGVARNEPIHEGQRVIWVWHGPCFRCGKTPAEGVDHVIPFVRGGRNEVENLQPACLYCNKSKGAKV